MTTRSNQALRFNYRYSLGSILLMMAVTVLLTAGFAHIAHTVPDVRLLGLLVSILSRETVSILLWGMTLLCFAASMFATVLAINARRKIRYVELGPKGAYVPEASLATRPITIPYNSILKIEVQNIRKQHMAVISSTAGEARLMDRFFDRPDDFRNFLQALEQRRRS